MTTINITRLIYLNERQPAGEQIAFEGENSDVSKKAGLYMWGERDSNYLVTKNGRVFIPTKEDLDITVFTNHLMEFNNQ